MLLAHSQDALQHAAATQGLVLMFGATVHQPVFGAETDMTYHQG